MYYCSPQLTPTRGSIEEAHLPRPTALLGLQQRRHLASTCLRGRDAARADALPWLRLAAFVACAAVEVVHGRVRLKTGTYGLQFVCVEGACAVCMAACYCAVHVCGALNFSMGRSIETNPIAQYTLGCMRSVLVEPGEVACSL